MFVSLVSRVYAVLTSSQTGFLHEITIALLALQIRLDHRHHS
jgi:hypothetical protein